MLIYAVVLIVTMILVWSRAESHFVKNWEPQHLQEEREGGTVIMAMLEVKNLGISFGGLRAVDDFNLSIEQGQLYGLIGPNGAGKTTVFNMLTGVYKPTDGKIFLDGEDITGKSTIEINKEGIARTFQNIRLFSDLSVLDNVKAGLHNQKEYEYSTLTGILRLPGIIRQKKL